MLKTLCFGSVKRFYCTDGMSKIKICIVGAGPAGFYAAQRLSKNLGSQSKIDIFERLPVPFGLIRYGVAPDHPDVKNVTSTFSKTATSPNVNFLGNVNVGIDVTLKELKDAYHVVLLSYGAEETRTLEIPGENLQNVVAAKKVVGWYNGLPWEQNLKIDLEGEVAVIIGQGNVAIDVARILLTPVDQLRKTDITEYALEKLANSKLKKIYLVGRRGPIQAAFTIKELREMLNLSKCSTIWNKENFEGVQGHIAELPRPKKRILQLMLDSAEKQSEKLPEGHNIFAPTFLRSPIKLLGDKRLTGVVLGVNTLSGNNILRQKAILTANTEILQCDLLISSIGYRGKQIDSDLPFDSFQGIAKNVNGRVEKGLYVSGWLGTGAVGVIVSTMNNAFNVADTIMHDLEKDSLETVNKPGYESIQKVLSAKNIPVIDWNGWKKINSYEEEFGRKLGKSREKLVDVQKMLEIGAH